MNTLRARPRAGLLALTLVAVAAPGCSSPAEPDWSDLIERTLAARQQWQGAAPPRYLLVQQRICQCPAEMAGPVRMVVRRAGAEEQIDSLGYASNGLPVEPAYRPGFLTVAALFDRILAMARAGVAELQAEFHPSLGYPVRFFVDIDERTGEDEDEYQITELAAH